MDFKDMERRYAAWKLLLESDDISAEEFEQRLEKMTTLDDEGNEWRIDTDTGAWLRLEEGEWLEDDPLAAPAPPPAKPRPDYRAITINFLREYWGWVAVAGVAVVLIGVIILVIQLITETPSLGSTDQPTAANGDTPAAASDSDSLPVDINTPPTLTPSPTPIPDEEIVDLGHEMVLIPAGEFRMGSIDEEIQTSYDICQRYLSEDDCREQNFEAESPAHQVTLQSYYIDLYEVTNEQFAIFLNEKQNQDEGGVPWLDVSDAEARLSRIGSSWVAAPDFANHPVTEVSWFGAQAYCKWRGGRLPTEAEWEKAARWNPETGEVSFYPWGDNPPNQQVANFRYGPGIPGKTSSEVGAFPQGVSATGLYDMAGNVFEWVHDWYRPNFYELGDMADPMGPGDGEMKVIKGGSWGDYAFLLHAANRGSLKPIGAFNFIGFRCAKTVGATVP